ncbi:ABC transporter ATP-binding protein [Streptomyces hainanensis]|nr:ABC transporter ATP-binding protein [Streptomyces hainanensis]
MMSVSDQTIERLPSSLVSLGRSLRLGYRASPGLIVVAFVTTVVSAVPDALLAWGIASLADSVLSGQGTEILTASLLLALLATATWLLNILSERANRRFADRAAVVVEAHIAELQASVATIEHHELPDHLDRISVLRDHAPALSDLYQKLFGVLGTILRLLITVSLLVFVHPLLVVLGFFVVPSVLVSNWRAGKEKEAEEDGAQHDRLARHLFLTATSAEAGKEVRVAQVGPVLRERRRQAWVRRYKPLARARWISAVYQSAALTLSAGAFMAALWYVATRDDAQAAQVLMVLAAGSRLSTYVGQTIGEMHFFRTIWLDCSRRLAWLEDYVQARKRTSDQPVPTELRRGIRLDGVSFAYPGTERLVLEDIELTLPAGAVVAVVGENGAGKSTLVKLLCGFYAPTAGRILADDTDLSRTDADRWRQRVTSAFQDFFPFEYPLRRSVGLGDLPRENDEAAVTSAVDRAGADVVVAALPHGLDTQLGVDWPGGVGLSHGQWQRVALARGFMREKPLLMVLDEPTSALDAETEHALFGRYAEIARDGGSKGTGRITLLVSHRFSTVRTADLIVVLDGARLVETGTHEQLMALGGQYAELYGLQAAAYQDGSAPSGSRGH